MSTQPPNFHALARVFSESNPRAHLGLVVPEEKIAEIIGLGREHAEYSRYLMWFRESLEDLLEVRHGRVFIAKQEDYGLRILDAKESAAYAPKQVDRFRRKMELWHLKSEACVVPVINQLSGEERRRFEAAQQKNARMILAMKKMEVRGDDDEEALPVRP